MAQIQGISGMTPGESAFELNEPFLVGYRKVYSGRREADVVMTSATGDYTNWP